MGLWSYQPTAPGSHRFDNFSVTILGGGAHPKARGLARPITQTGPSAPPANTTYRLYYYAAGRPIALRVLPPGHNTGTLYYLHSDHLGSISVVSDLSGSAIARQWYHPYGGVRASTGALPTRRTYTGQLSDETGLYFYNARYYSPLIGRFISADTLVPEPGNPQALNRYAYVFNNPLRYTDPTGHCPICLTAAIGAVVGGGIAYGVQVAANISQNGLTVNALTEINWAAVGAGVAAGAVGGATFGLGTAVLGTGAVATLASGAASGAVAGQAAIATENALSGRAVTEGLGDPGDILRDAAIGGALAGVGLTIHGRLVQSRLPTFEVDPNLTPQIANNIATAQAAGKPSILHRLTDPVKIAQNRREAIKSYTGPGSPDEYPFASTYEGGAGAQVRGVPLHEQRIQGGKLAQFYRKNAIGDGDAFKVIVRRR